MTITLHVSPILVAGVVLGILLLFFARRRRRR
jgi:LPXTG-motif cell wall-anchored protein